MVIFSSEAFRVLLMTFLKHKTGITDKLTKILYSRPNSHAGVVFFNVYLFDCLFQFLLSHTCSIILFLFSFNFCLCYC